MSLSVFCTKNRFGLLVALLAFAFTAPTFGFTQQAKDSGLADPVRLEADGEPIDIGKLSGIAHAGPWIADVDGDGDEDLLVGDFPGFFWLFDNIGSDLNPVYTSKGKLNAGGKAAKTPVY